MKKTVISGLLAASILSSAQLFSQTPTPSLVDTPTPIGFSKPQIYLPDVPLQQSTPAMVSKEISSPAQTSHIKCENEGFIPILLFHSIYHSLEPGARNHLTEPVFEAMLSYLYRDDFFLVPLDDAVNGTMHLPKGKKPVVLSVDDCIENPEFIQVYKNFTEVHKDFGRAAVFFVSSPYENLGTSKTRLDEILEEFSELNITIEGHGTKHCSLRNATVEQARAEVEPLLEKFKKHGIPAPKYWAYAYGYYPNNKDVRDYFKEHFKACFVVDGEPFNPHKSNFNPMRIKRIDGARLKPVEEILKEYSHCIYIEK